MDSDRHAQHTFRSEVLPHSECSRRGHEWVLERWCGEQAMGRWQSYWSERVLGCQSTLAADLGRAGRPWHDREEREDVQRGLLLGRDGGLCFLIRDFADLQCRDLILTASIVLGWVTRYKRIHGFIFDTVQAIMSCQIYRSMGQLPRAILTVSPLYYLP